MIFWRVKYRSIQQNTRVNLHNLKNYAALSRIEAREKAMKIECILKRTKKEKLHSHKIVICRLKDQTKG